MIQGRVRAGRDDGRFRFDWLDSRTSGQHVSSCRVPHDSWTSCMRLTWHSLQIEGSFSGRTSSEFKHAVMNPKQKKRIWDFPEEIGGGGGGGGIRMGVGRKGRWRGEAPPSHWVWADFTSGEFPRVLLHRQAKAGLGSGGGARPPLSSSAASLSINHSVCSNWCHLSGQDSGQGQEVFVLLFSSKHPADHHFWETLEIWAAKDRGRRRWRNVDAPIQLSGQRKVKLTVFTLRLSHVKTINLRNNEITCF